MDLSRIPVNKGANSRFGWRKYNYYPPLLTEASFISKNRILELFLYVCMIKTPGGSKKYEKSITTFTIITLYESELLTSVIQANIP